MTDFSKINLTVISKSSENAVKKISPGNDETSINMAIKVRAAPEKNKANDAIIALIAKFFGIKKSDISIVCGHTSRKKIIHINQLSIEKLKKILEGN